MTTASLATLLKDLGVQECRDGGMAAGVLGGRMRRALEMNGVNTQECC